VAVRPMALVSDESALEACSRKCAIQIDDLNFFYFYTGRYIRNVEGGCD